MKITWRGHACFVVESGGYEVILDPYHEVTGLPDISGTANEALCSHGHHDHSYLDELRLLGGASPFTVEKLDTFHDEKEGALRGKNTVHILSAEGLRVVHLGDLGHPLSEEQMRALGTIDVLMIPIGGTYTLDSAQAAQQAAQLNARIVIPMHYRFSEHGYEVLESVEAFVEKMGDAPICRKDGSSITVDADTPAQVCVLSWEN